MINAISTTQNTNNRGCAAVSIIQQGSETLLQDPGEKVERFILTAGSGTYSSCFRFRDATNSTEGYLACTSSGSNNYLKTSNSNNGYDNWVQTQPLVDITDDIDEATNVSAPPTKTDETAEETARYNLQGQQLNEPQRGVNIVRMSDNTAHKTLVR